MLADGQDPTALEARLAFHLHRLNLTGEPLRKALKGKAYLATALSQGRVTIQNGFIEELAASLNIAADELIRPLLEEETQHWTFYRHSAQNRQAVWEKAMALARSNNMSLRDTAATMGISHADFINATSGRKPRVLELHHAQRLAATTNPPANPLSLLPDDPSR